MKMKNKRLFFALVCIGVGLFMQTGHAAADITLRIEGQGAQILNTALTVPETCEVTDTTTTTPTSFAGDRAICALQAAQEQGLLTYQTTNWGDGLGFSLDAVNGIQNAADWSESWALYRNLADPGAGISNFSLAQGDELLVTYGPWPMTPLAFSINTSSPVAGEEILLAAQTWDADESGLVPVNTAVTFMINGVSFESASGTLAWTPETAGDYTILAEAPGMTHSQTRTVTVAEAPALPEPPSASAHLFLRHEETVLFDDTISLEPVVYHDDVNNLDYTLSSSSVFSLLVAADEQSDAFDITDAQFNENFQSFFVACITGEAGNTTTPACYNWQYVVNGAYAMVGMDQYPLEGNEQVSVYFGERYDLSVSTTTMTLGQTTTATLREYEYATNAWVPAQGNLLLTKTIAADFSNYPPQIIASSSLDVDGMAAFAPSATGTFLIAVPDSFWPNQILTVIEAPQEAPEQNDPPANNGGGDSPSPSQNTAVSSAIIQQTADRILAFFKAQQNESGFILDGGTTDWVSMSFGAAGTYADTVAKKDTSLKDAVVSYAFADPSDINLCAAYPRHILGLLAAGIAPTDTRVQELALQTQSADCYTQNQYGQNGINDDVFALLALLALGADVDSPVITNILNAITNDQTDDGAFTWAGFAGADITGGALNALLYAKEKGASVDAGVIDAGFAYLKQTQLADGGWGFGTSDALTTSWALMGILARGDGQTEWTTAQNKNPWHVLTDTLTEDGYYETDFGNGPIIDWFGTKHAVPALLGKAWPVILSPKTGQEPQPSDNSNPTQNQPQQTGGGVPAPNNTPPADSNNKASKDAVQSNERVVESTHVTEMLRLEPAQKGVLRRSFETGEHVEISVQEQTASVPLTFRTRRGTFGSEHTPLDTARHGLLTHTIFVIEAADDGAQPVTSFDAPLTLVFRIPELSNATGTFGVFFFNEETTAWEAVQDCAFEGALVTCRVEHLTKFTVLQIQPETHDDAVENEARTEQESSAEAAPTGGSVAEEPKTQALPRRAPIQAVAGTRVVAETESSEAADADTTAENPAEPDNAALAAEKINENESPNNRPAAAIVFWSTLAALAGLLLRLGWNIVKL